MWGRLQNGLVLERKLKEPIGALKVKLFTDMRTMVVHSVEADIEILGDLLARLAVSNHPQDAVLRRREGGQ
jgi:hypothetical protein